MSHSRLLLCCLMCYVTLCCILPPSDHFLMYELYVSLPDASIETLLTSYVPSALGGVANPCSPSYRRKVGMYCGECYGMD